MSLDSLLEDLEQNPITDNHNSLTTPSIWHPNKAYGFEKATCS